LLLAVFVVCRYLSPGGICRHKGAPKTNSAGRFSGHFKLYVSAPMFAQYNGDAAHFASASKRIKVTATRSHGRLAGAGAGRGRGSAATVGEAWARDINAGQASQPVAIS
jgi:hypothetical protein